MLCMQLFIAEKKRKMIIASAWINRKAVIIPKQSCWGSNTFREPRYILIFCMCMSNCLGCNGMGIMGKRLATILSLAVTVASKLRL